MHKTFISDEVISRAKKIKVVFFDVDGVMTDVGLMIGDDGQEYKTFHSHDGLGMKLLNRTTVEMAIITGRTSEVVKTRAKTNGIKYLYQGIEDKLETFNDLISKLGAKAEQAAFMGDDIVDIPPMLSCGLAIAVPAAHDTVKDRAHYVTTKEGGKGAVREVCEVIMHAQGTYDEVTANYFNPPKIGSY